MKIIHCADIHLGSKITSSFPREKANERKIELRGAFNEIIKYAGDNNIKIILISGDLFDSYMPAKKDKDMFYSAVRNNPLIDFIYLRGNHDNSEVYEESLPNLKYFTNENWKTVSYNDNGKIINIIGAEIGENWPELIENIYCEGESTNSTNIVMLHGMTGDSSEKGEIVLKKFAGKNIDYLALGHVHSYLSGRVDKRCEYCYPGCILGRGFDETGEKGFVILDTDRKSEDGGIYKEFYQINERIIEEKDVDINNAKDIYEIRKIVNDAVKPDSSLILRLNLVGMRYFDCENLEEETENELKSKIYYISVKDKTVRNYNTDEFAESSSFTGNFVRNVLSSDMSDEDKNSIISLGIRALRKENLEI